MQKDIDLGGGYYGAVATKESGLDEWAVSKGGTVIHTGYAQPGKSVELMKAFIETGTAVVPEPVVEPVVEPEAPPADSDYADESNTEPLESVPDAEAMDVAEEPIDDPVVELDNETPKPKQGKLPEDFPYHDLLVNGDIATYAQLRKAIANGTLTDVAGIAEARAAEIVEASE